MNQKIEWTNKIVKHPTTKTEMVLGVVAVFGWIFYWPIVIWVLWVMWSGTIGRIH